MQAQIEDRTQGDRHLRHHRHKHGVCRRRGRPQDHPYVEVEIKALPHRHDDGRAEGNENSPQSLVPHPATEAIHEHPDCKENGQNRDHQEDHPHHGHGCLGIRQKVRHVGEMDARNIGIIGSGRDPQHGGLSVAEVDQVGGGGVERITHRSRLPFRILHLVALRPLRHGANLLPVRAKISVADGSFHHAVGGIVIVSYDASQKPLAEKVQLIPGNSASHQADHHEKAEENQSHANIDSLAFHHTSHRTSPFCRRLKNARISPATSS